MVFPVPHSGPQSSRLYPGRPHLTDSRHRPHVSELLTNLEKTLVAVSYHNLTVIQSIG